MEGGNNVPCCLFVKKIKNIVYNIILRIRNSLFVGSVCAQVYQLWCGTAESSECSVQCVSGADTHGDSEEVNPTYYQTSKY